MNRSSKQQPAGAPTRSRAASNVPNSNVTNSNVASDRVDLEAYRRRMRVSALRRVPVTPQDIDRAFAGTVLDATVPPRLGIALDAARPIVLAGPSGAGKTFIAERLAATLSGDALMPIALDLDGRRVPVYDPDLHVRSGESAPDGWVCVRPPVIRIDAALMPSHDDLARLAGLALAAAQGVLIVERIGAQADRDRATAALLLDAAERGRLPIVHADGSPGALPFSARVVFTTRLEGAALDTIGLGDDRATTIALGGLPEGGYRELIDVLAAARGVEVPPPAAEHLIELHRTSAQPLLPGTVAAVVQALADRARYFQRIAILATPATPALIDWAWRERFGALPRQAQGGPERRALGARGPRLAYSRNRAKPATGSRSVTKPFSGRDGSA